MAWDNPSNQSLGLLGNLAGGNANNTSSTSLNDCARDSGTAETEMWGDFRPGGGDISIVRDGGSDGNGRGYHQVKVSGLSASWANGGGTSSADITLESSLDTGLDDADEYHDIIAPSRSSAGSLYGSRIVAISASEYNYDFRLDASSSIVVDYSGNDDPDNDGSKDKFRTTAV